VDFSPFCKKAQNDKGLFVILTYFDDKARSIHFLQLCFETQTFFNQNPKRQLKSEQSSSNPYFTKQKPNFTHL